MFSNVPVFKVKFDEFWHSMHPLAHHCNQHNKHFHTLQKFPCVPLLLISLLLPYQPILRWSVIYLVSLLGEFVFLRILLNAILFFLIAD